MKEFNIQVPCVGNTGILKQALTQLEKQLGIYGFQLTCAVDSADNVVQFKITADGEVYMDETLSLTADNVAKIARFAEQVYVQYALNELIPRMALLGWKHDDPFQQERRTISIQTTDLKSPKAYEPTYAGMAQLRYDLDAAEVRYLMETTRPVFKTLNWKVLTGDNTYTVYYDDTFSSIGFSDVAKAREVTQMAMANMFAKTLDIDDLP